MAFGERCTCFARIYDMPGTLLVPHHYFSVFLIRKLSVSGGTETNFPRSYNLQLRMLRLALSSLKAQVIAGVTLPLYGKVYITLQKCLFASFLVLLGAGDNVCF